MTGLADKPAQALAAQSQVEVILKSALITCRRSWSRPPLPNRNPTRPRRSRFMRMCENTTLILPRPKNHSPSSTPKTRKTTRKLTRLRSKPARPFPAIGSRRDFGHDCLPSGRLSRAPQAFWRKSARQKNGDAESSDHLVLAQHHLNNRAESKTALHGPWI